MIKRKKKDNTAVQVVDRLNNDSFVSQSTYAVQTNKKQLYDSMRKNIPSIDGAIDLCVQLSSGFTIKSEDKKIEKLLNNELEKIEVNGISHGIDAFVSSYLSSLLTYGTAVGEMVYSKDMSKISLYNSDLVGISLKRDKNTGKMLICTDKNNTPTVCKCQDNILLSLLDAKPGTVTGTSVLESLPFVSSILMQIFDSIGTNWKRFGDIRYCVSCKNSSDSLCSEKARTIAQKWREAMREDSGGDFVTVGDVEVKVIGSDGQILSSETPVRQIMEQIIAKLGIPPFLLGMSFSTTETMAKQQISVFESKLDHYRRIITPILKKICTKILRLHNLQGDFEIVFNSIYNQ